LTTYFTPCYPILKNNSGDQHICFQQNQNFFLSVLFLIILLIFSSFAPPGSVVRSGSMRADLKEQMEDLFGKEYSDRLIDTISHDGKIFNLYESMSFRFENAKFNCKSPNSAP